MVCAREGNEGVLIPIGNAHRLAPLFLEASEYRKALCKEGGV